MSKKDKKEKAASTASIPEGMKCYKKVGGGIHRFPNRIIKPGQKVWMFPNHIPSNMKDLFQPTDEDRNAVVVNLDTDYVPKIVDEEYPENTVLKFEIVPATDEDGKPLKKGNDTLYNVIGEDGKVMNEKPLRKGKADEFLATLN